MIFHIVLITTVGCGLAAVAQLPELIQATKAAGLSPLSTASSFGWAMLASSGIVAPLATGLLCTRQAAISAANNEPLAWAAAGAHPLLLLRPYVNIVLPILILSLVLTLHTAPVALSRLITNLQPNNNEAPLGVVARLDSETWVSCGKFRDQGCLVIRHKPDGRILLLAAQGIKKGTLVEGEALGQGRTPGAWALLQFASLSLPSTALPKVPIPPAAISALTDTPGQTEFTMRCLMALSSPALALLGALVGFKWGKCAPALPLGLALCTTHRTLCLLADFAATPLALPLALGIILVPALWRPRTA
jgi:hypothetical protein